MLGEQHQSNKRPRALVFLSVVAAVTGAALLTGVGQSSAATLPKGATLEKVSISPRVYWVKSSSASDYVTNAEYVAAGRPTVKTVTAIPGDRTFKVSGQPEIYYEAPDGSTLHMTEAQWSAINRRAYTTVSSWPSEAFPKPAATTTTSAKPAAASASTVTATVKTGPRDGNKYIVSIPSGQAGASVAAAVKAVAAHTPYSSPGSTSLSSSVPSTLDCSGLTRWAVYQGTNGKVTLPHSVTSQLSSSKVSKVSSGSLKPGDLIASYGGGHVVMYIGKMSYSSSKGAYVTDSSGTEMYAAAVENGRDADIGPLNSGTNPDIVGYVRPDYS